MKLRWIESEDASIHDLSELPDLRNRTDGFLWLDIPEWSENAEPILANKFHFHPLAIAKAKNRNHVPESTCIRTTCSSSCTRQRSARAATCTISSWTNSLERISWSFNATLFPGAAHRQARTRDRAVWRGRAHSVIPFPRYHYLSNPARC
jgi:hypothetical protein